jgi:hypothetical protein
MTSTAFSSDRLECGPAQSWTPFSPARWRAVACALSLVLFGVTPALYAANSAYEAVAKPQRATVSVLALCTSVRGSLNSQDVYLAYISTPHRGRQLARLVDAYPGYEKPIRASLLKEQQQFRMMLVRDPESDVAYSALHMPQEESARFGTVAPEAIAELPGGTLPSFLIVHGKTKLGLTKAVEPDR